MSYLFGCPINSADEVSPGHRWSHVVPRVTRVTRVHIDQNLEGISYLFGPPTARCRFSYTWSQVVTFGHIWSQWSLGFGITRQQVVTFGTYSHDNALLNVFGERRLLFGKMPDLLTADKNSILS